MELEEKKALSPEEERLTDTDLDVLSGMLIIFLHSAERIIQLMELEYDQRYRASREYKELCRKHGKLQVDHMLKTKVREIVRGDERHKLGKILKSAKEFHMHMETLNKAGREAHSSNVTELDAFDAIEHDKNFLCYMYALLANCLTDEDELKVLSWVKLIAKGTRVSDRILERLKPKVA
jgi:hypothetical protein